MCNRKRECALNKLGVGVRIPGSTLFYCSVSVMLYIDADCVLLHSLLKTESGFSFVLLEFEVYDEIRIESKYLFLFLL